MSTVPSRHHSRRSTAALNFTHSISPLTTNTLTESHFTTTRPAHVRSSSYIAQRSAPGTPGILSSRTVPHTPKHAPSDNTHDYFAITLPKSKSAGHLQDSWITRTGAALSCEARESKGQSWLTTRASSTSLVDEFQDEDGVEVMWGEDGDADDGDAEDEDDEAGGEGGFGLGMWVDRLVGWGLAAEEESDSEGEEEEVVRERRERERRRMREVERRVGEERRRARREGRDEEEGWQDPAWVLSLATSILF